MNMFAHTLLARVVLAAAASMGLSLALSSAALAKVRITVDLDAQTMHVEAKDKVFDWKVSSGKFGYETPNGKYGVLWMDKNHFSQEYDQAPMPDAIFFAPGYAIHGAYKSAFGHAASHGCVRLPVAKAAVLFDLVKVEGAEVNIVGESPANVATSHARPRDDAAAERAPRYGYDDGRDDGFERAAGPRGRAAAEEPLYDSVY